MLAEVSIKISKAIFPIWIYNYNINIKSLLLVLTWCMIMMFGE